MNPDLGELIAGRLLDYPTVTREDMRMLADAGRILEARGLCVSPQIGVPGDYLVEWAFVESFDTAPVPAARVKAVPQARMLVSQG